MDLSLLQKLHGPCSGKTPAGANLEYDPGFLEMMRLSESRPEVQYGPTILAAKDPDWLQLLDACLSVAESTRDLRVAVLIVESLSRLHDWAGLASGLELLESWLVQLWDHIYPLLDEEEQGDPTQRLSVLAQLVGEERLLKGIALMPLAEHRSLGRLTLRDYNSMFSNGDNGTKISPAELEIIFSEMNTEELSKLHHDIKRSIKAFSAIDRFLIEQVGAARWSGAAFTEVLNKADKVIRSHGAGQARPRPEQRTVEPMVSASKAAHQSLPEVATPAASDAHGIPSVELRFDPANDSVESSSDPNGTRVPTRILTRTEATIAIDSICDYFEKHEPASPVPLILKRAKRLIPMSFVEILHELAPKESHEFLQHLVCSK